MGKLPPPYIGPATATQIILHSDINRSFNIHHFDTSDHRDVSTLAKWDVINILLAIHHYISLVYCIIRLKPQLVYIPAGQTTVGYLRDAIFILIAKSLKRKVICHLRGGNFLNWYQNAPKWVQRVVRLTHRRVDAQIVLSRKFIPLFSWIMPEEKIFVVPNGGDFEVAAFPKGEQEKTQLLFLSNFIYSKGILDLVKAINLLDQSVSAQLNLLLSGAFSEGETKLRLLQYLDNHPDLPVKILGPVKGEEKTRLLESSDIFILPTFYNNEGMPWAIIEALAAGLPVISCRHAAIEDCVENGVNGILVEQQSPRDLAKAITSLIKNRETIRKMGAASRRKYESDFTEDKMVEALARAFSGAIG